ncbi:MAG: hypothetical protein ACUVV6_01155 [Thermoplasmatota archaeon]
MRGEGAMRAKRAGGEGPGRELLVYCAGPMRSGGKYVESFYEMIRIVEGLGHCALTELSSTVRWGALEELTEGAEGGGAAPAAGGAVVRRIGREAGRGGVGRAGAGAVPGGDPRGELRRGEAGEGGGRDGRGLGEGWSWGGANGAAMAGEGRPTPSAIDAYIYMRDLHWLDRADALVAEVSGPSLGVGYEVSYALHVRRIPSLCLCHREVRALSAMISGNTSPLLRLERYSGSEDMRVTIIDFLSENLRREHL